MGGEQSRVLLVGCEPLDFGPEEEGKLGLSETVQAAVDEAVAMIETLVSKMVLQTN
jgi:hydrogenase maturation protease